MKKIKMIVEKTGTGFSAYTEKHSIATTGENIDELKANMLEAINLYFEDESKVFAAEDIAVVYDIPQFFEYYSIINQSKFAEKIGMPRSLLTQYVRGNKKPSARQTKRIFEGLRRVARELSSVEIK